MLVSICMAALVMAGIFARAQATPAPPQTPVSESVLKAKAEEVSLDLVVRDKKNHAILDLKPGDLSIIDDGAPVELSTLRLVQGKAATDHLVTLIFDQLDPASARDARDAAAKILKLMPQEGFTFAVASVDSRLRLLQDFTKDRTVLNKALIAATRNRDTGRTDEAAIAEKTLLSRMQTDSQTGSEPIGVAGTVEQRTRARVLLMALEGSQRIIDDRHAQPSLAALEALSNAQRIVPGRKVVIYFAHELEQDANTGDRIRSIVGTANKAGVNIYVINATALDPDASQQLLSAMAMGGQATYFHLNPLPVSNGPGSLAHPSDVESRKQATDQTDRFENDNLNGGKTPLAKLASGTGGVYLNSGESLKKPMRRLVEDMTSYYEASYIPVKEEYDGRFRAVAVKPLRAGLVVHSRAGYFSLPPESSLGIQPFEAPLLKALAEPALPAEFAFESAVLHISSAQNGNTDELAIEVPVANLDMRKDANTNLFSVHLAMMAQVRTQDGKVVEHFSEDIPRHGALDAMQAAKSEVITLQRHFAEPPGKYVLEAAVLDRNSGKAAAKRTEFELTAPIPSATDGPTLSDITLIRRMDPIDADTDPFDPLLYQNARIVPNLSGEVSRQSQAVSLFFILHPANSSTEPAKLELQLLKDGRPLATSPLLPGGGKGDVPYLSSIRVQSLSTGTYELKATATQAGKIVSRTASFSVVGSDAEIAALQPPIIDAGRSDGKSIVDAEPGANARDTGALIITSNASLIKTPLPREASAVLEGATQRAVNYSSSLPNFTCIEITNRSVDRGGNGRWKQKDRIAELLRYRDNKETHVTLEVNGRRSNAQRSDLKGAMSSGEFGGVLASVFDPASKADFKWKETVMLSGEPAQVFDYRVPQASSTFALSGDYNYRMTVGFHGLVYIDNATQSVRRVTLEAEVPSDSSIHSTSIEVEYRFISINAHDYLMPVRARLALRQGKHQAVLNEIEFRDYRRFGSQVRVVGFTPVAE
jgi:VWFA-related protein